MNDCASFSAATAAPRRNIPPRFIVRLRCWRLRRRVRDWRCSLDFCVLSYGYAIIRFDFVSRPNNS
jgi:hypothetical protein